MTGIRSGRRVVWQAAASLLALALAFVLAAAQVGRVPTWFYVCAWYPTLALLDALSGSRPSLFADPRRALSLFGWSAIIWLGYEAANFRLEDWYYVFLPADRLERWTGILVSFATVVPALVLAARVLERRSVGASWRGRAIHVDARGLRWCTLIGVGFLAAALLWPRLFFPLIWGAGLFLCDPFVYRNTRAPSLIGDLERGEWGRIGRLATGGLGIGFLWEAYNHLAQGKWIYTVPWLEETKLFEIPPYGLVGFPVLALSAWAMYHALVAARVALPIEAAGAKPTAPPDRAAAGRRPAVRTVAAAAAALLFAALTLAGMDRYTISSVVPRGSELEALTPDGRRLVFLRGIGTAGARRLAAAGIHSVAELAAADPRSLARALDALTDQALARLSGCPCRPPTAGEVRVWIRAARRSLRS